MRVVVAAVSSNRSMSGVTRHAANLVRSLLTRPEVTAVNVMVAPWEHAFVSAAISRQDRRLSVHAVPLRPGTVKKNLWYYYTLPALARQLRADVVHLAYPSPVLSGAFPCPVVTTLHDLYPYDVPANFGFPKVVFNRAILRQCLEAVDAIACVSDSTRLELGKKMPRMLVKAVTIPNCVEPAPSPVMPCFAASWVGKPFLLCVAQHRRNKNIPVALRAFQRLVSEGSVTPDTRFLLIGMPGPETRRIEDFIRDSGLASRVVIEDGISDAEMNWCYRNCQLLIAPSIIEGFGLPIAEGRLAGCRIVCSDIAAFREAGGPGSRFVELGPEADQDFAREAAAYLGERRPLPAYLPHLAPTALVEQYLRLYTTVFNSWKGRKTIGAGIRNLAKGAEVSEAKAALAGEVPTSAGS